MRSLRASSKGNEAGPGRGSLPAGALPLAAISVGGVWLLVAMEISESKKARSPATKALEGAALPQKAGKFEHLGSFSSWAAKRRRERRRPAPGRWPSHTAVNQVKCKKGRNTVKKTTCKISLLTQQRRSRQNSLVKSVNRVRHARASWPSGARSV